MGLVGAALTLFEQLELWDNLIVCYQLLDKRVQVSTARWACGGRTEVPSLVRCVLPAAGQASAGGWVGAGAGWRRARDGMVRRHLGRPSVWGCGRFLGGWHACTVSRLLLHASCTPAARLRLHCYKSKARAVDEPAPAGPELLL